ncbi:MAG: putative CAMK family protein kinase [Streblomastix strix]|uniref:Putative CAMK family protein kinase n=1 Tax=Streblomastix strix TaxID=222440 RepID=A0A5J4W433_9EUKA|nr:MAG: putative CAMK family protein kinase [Streblomastix strix]
MQPLEVLGEGSYGRVFLTYNNSLGYVAAKMIDEKKFKPSEFEVGQQHSLQNPFTLNYIKTDEKDNLYMILMEYCNYSDLSILTKSANEIPIAIIRPIMKQILQGLKFMHEAGLVHRDLKDENILLNNPEGSDFINVKIADLGIMKIMKDVTKETLMSLIGNRATSAPELQIGDMIADGKADVWSAGIVLFQLRFRKYPYAQLTPISVIEFMNNKKLECPDQQKNDILWDLITKMLEFDKNKRLTAAEALKHQFFVSEQAENEILQEARQIAHKSLEQKQKGNVGISEFDTNSSYIIPLPNVEQITNKFLSDNMKRIEKLRNSNKLPSKEPPQAPTDIPPQLVEQPQAWLTVASDIVQSQESPNIDTIPSQKAQEPPKSPLSKHNKTVSPLKSNISIIQQRRSISPQPIYIKSPSPKILEDAQIVTFEQISKIKREVDIVSIEDQLDQETFRLLFNYLIDIKSINLKQQTQTSIELKKASDGDKIIKCHIH